MPGSSDPFRAGIPSTEIADAVAQASGGEIRYTNATFATLRSRGDSPPFYRVGGRVFYDRDGVLDWIRSRRTKTVRAARELRRVSGQGDAA